MARLFIYSLALAGAAVVRALEGVSRLIVRFDIGHYRNSRCAGYRLPTGHSLHTHVEYNRRPLSLPLWWGSVGTGPWPPCPKRSITRRSTTSASTSATGALVVCAKQQMQMPARTCTCRELNHLSVRPSWHAHTQ